MEPPRRAPGTSPARPIHSTESSRPRAVHCFLSISSSSPEPKIRKVQSGWRGATSAQVSRSMSMPFWSESRPTLTTTFSVREEGTSGMKGIGFGMKDASSRPWRIHRSASSRVSASIRSTSLSASAPARSARSPSSTRRTWLMPMTVRPVVSASSTHSIAHTGVTITTAPGRAAWNSRVSLAACSRIPVARSARSLLSATLSRPLMPCGAHTRRVDVVQRRGGVRGVRRAPGRPRAR